MMKNRRKKQRIGRFIVSQQFMMSNDEYLIAMQKSMAVIAIDSSAALGIVEFTAVGDMFNEVNEGEFIPLYVAELYVTPDETLSFRFLVDEGNNNVSY